MIFHPAGPPFYRFGDCKRSQEFVGSFAGVRARFLTGRLFIVCDNLSPRRKAKA